METLEKSRKCRLCGKHSGIAIDIFDKTENHMRKINAILPILVHEMDLLPKQMCHRCSYKLEEFYNFYVDCAKTDTELKSQLSWMRKENLEEKIITPMVKMNKFKIKTEPSDNDGTINANNVFGRTSENSLMFPSSILQHSFDTSTRSALTCSHCQCICNKSIKVNNSMEQINVITHVESETQMSNCNVISAISDKVIEINKLKSVDKNIINKNKFESNNSKKENIQEIFNVNHIHSDSNLNIHNDKNFNSEKLNRALRPRKGLIDYKGQKKKTVTLDLKKKIKSKLNIFSSSLINPVDNNLIHPSPVIKLQKVDDTIRTLRTRKNLEEFNRRINEFKHKQIWQKEENQNKKNINRQGNENRKSLKTNVSNKKNDDSEKNEQYFISMANKTSENVMRVMELKIKQEIVNKIPDNEFSKQLMQKKSFEVNCLKNKKICKSIDRYPLCTVVKLEKDYTCNVDYPRIKIKRHLAVRSPMKLENNPLEISVDQNSTFKLTVNGKPCIKSENNISPKKLRSTERGLKVSNKKIKSEKISRKKKKNLDLVKRILLEKTSIVSQNDLKRFCEKCDTCFRNKELYKLHPCYQN